jgi:hypothetical protein
LSAQVASKEKQIDGAMTETLTAVTRSPAVPKIASMVPLGVRWPAACAGAVAG